MILAMLITEQHLQQHSQWDPMSVFFIIIIMKPHVHKTISDWG